MLNFSKCLNQFLNAFQFKFYSVRQRPVSPFALSTPRQFQHIANYHTIFCLLCSSSIPFDIKGYITRLKFISNEERLVDGCLSGHLHNLNIQDIEGFFISVSLLNYIPLLWIETKAREVLRVLTRANFHFFNGYPLSHYSTVLIETFIWILRTIVHIYIRFHLIKSKLKARQIKNIIIYFPVI